MTILCELSDITDQQAKGFLSPKGPIFVVKDGGQVYVYANECPHLGVNLEFMKDEFLDSDGALIQCSTHGALFDKTSGLCLAGPCQGQHLTKIDFTIIDNQISV